MDQCTAANKSKHGIQRKALLMSRRKIEVPLREDTTEKMQLPKIEHITARQLNKLIKTDEECEVFLCRMVTQEKSLDTPQDPKIKEIAIEPGVHLAVVPLLKKYEDVFPEELPRGLPPKRTLDHRIDLIPGAETSKKAIYQISDIE